MGNATPPAGSLDLANIRTFKSQWNGHLSHWVTKHAKSRVKRHCPVLEFTAKVHPRASCSYLVMRSHVEGHKPLEENLRGFVVAKEGISINIVAGSGVKQPKQIKENPEQDTLLPRVTWICGFPSTWEEEPLVLSRNILGRKRREINSIQLSRLPRAAAYEAKGQNSLFNSSIAPSPFHRTNGTQEDTAHRLQARGSQR